MTCPNCKTELIEVNGRYICPDCGREIPENEVMAGDWGSGGTTRAGLYGAGTDDKPEAGSKTTVDAGTSLLESESNENLASEEKKIAAEPSVEEILQEQKSDIPAFIPEVPVPETGFYEAPKPTVSETVTPVVTQETPELVIPTPAVPEEQVVQPEIPTPEPTIQPEAQEIPMPVTIQPETIAAPEPIPEQTGEVKDMFENAAIPVNSQQQDPGIYTDPLYDMQQNAVQQPEVASPTNMPMPAEARRNLIVLIGGSVLTLLLVGGGIWGYLALNAKNNVAPPVINDQPAAWQDFEESTGKFKISFPGQPDTADGTQAINGIETAVTSYAYTSDDMTYKVDYVPLDTTNTKAITDNLQITLPALVGEIATGMMLKATDIKIGTYYAADAVDFKLTSDTAVYSGKLMLRAGDYILVIAGSDSGQSVEYNKFIKSFSFDTSKGSPE